MGIQIRLFEEREIRVVKVCSDWKGGYDALLQGKISLQGMYDSLQTDNASLQGMHAHLQVDVAALQTKRDEEYYMTMFWALHVFRITFLVYFPLLLMVFISVNSPSALQRGS